MILRPGVRHALPCLVLLCWSACARRDDPEAAWLAWMEHLAEGRLVEAYAGLDARSRAEIADLEANSAELQDLRADVPRGFRLFAERFAPSELGGLPPVPRDPKAYLMGSERAGDRATILVRALGAPKDAPAAHHRVELIREDGAWRVVLRF